MDFVCLVCNSSFSSPQKNRKTCSKKCQGLLMSRKLSKPKIRKTCLFCEVDFYVKPCHEDTAKFCSYSCKGRFEALKRWGNAYVDKEKSKKTRRDYKKKLRQISELEMIRNRLSASLRHGIVKFNEDRPGSFRNLSYTPREAVEHFQNEIIKGCLHCHEEILGDWHIAHRIPVCSANTEEELIGLFALDNLSVAHPTCNFLNGSKVVE